MTRLSELLMNEEALAALLEAETPEDLIKIQETCIEG